MSEIALALVGMGKMGRAIAELAPERGFRVARITDDELAADPAVGVRSLLALLGSRG